MSQYPPNPYQTPQAPAGYPGGYGVDPSVQALAPCRRAGALMFVYAGLLVVLAVLVAAVGLAAPANVIEEVIRQQRSRGMNNGASAGVELTVEVVRSVYVGIGVVIGALGILYAILAVFVRRGGRGAIVTGIVFTILLLLFSTCTMFMVMSEGALGGVVGLIPLAVTVWLLVWLFGANTAAGRWQMWQHQYAGQYYAYQQQQQQGQYPPAPAQQAPASQYWQQPGQPQAPPPPPQPPPQNWGPPPQL